MSKILFFLNTAFNVSEVNSIPVQKGSSRVDQYVSGLTKFFEFDSSKYGHEITIVLSDNTINKVDVIDGRILEVLDNHQVIYDIKGDNEFGAINKGAGVLASWVRASELISEHDFILHFEPRLLLRNYNFLDTFLNEPRNLITIGANKRHFNTGLLVFESTTFIKFIETINIETIAKRKISLEYVLYKYILDNQINFDTTVEMGVRWFDSAKQVFHDM